MLKTIVKNGVIVETIDTCETLADAKAEVQIELMKSKDAYIKDMWAFIGYERDVLTYAQKGEAPAQTQANYNQLVSECDKEYNRLIGLLNNCTTNMEAYAIHWRAEMESHQQMVDENSNGIFDILERLVFWK